VRFIPFIVILLLFSCTRSSDQRIELPVVSPDYYWKSLRKVNKAYQEKPSDQLLQQKLYYYEKLNWPEESINDLNTFLEKNGLDPKIVRLFLQYYLNNDQYTELIALLDKWEFYNGLDEELAQYRVLSNYRAKGLDGTKELILDYIDKFRSPESFEFAVKQSVQIKDTLLMKECLSELFNTDPSNFLITKYYVPILLKGGNTVKAYAILKSQGSEASEEEALLMARALYQMDSIGIAKNMLSEYTSIEMQLQLASWYRKEGQYDSAIYYLDLVLATDSSRHLLLTKADVFQERGWLISSNLVYDVLIKRDSTDSIAVQKSAFVERKIAYLRSLKEEEKKIPILEITPKRLIE
jgi:hypothetical protein